MSGRLHHDSPAEIAGARRGPAPANRGGVVLTPYSRCPGCGLEMPTGEMPYDGYYRTSPECFAVYSEVLGAEFGNAILFGQVHQLTVDAYAVQHAGEPHPDKSVDVHLVGLYLALERGVASPDVPAYLRRLAGAVDVWPHFEPPDARGELTVLDVALAQAPLEQAQQSRAWGRETWEIWSPHHAAVAELARRSFPR